MPLVGPICCKTREPGCFEGCILSARKGECLHSVPLLTNMSKSGRGVGREDAGMSATMLTGCPRRLVLSEAADYYESPADYYARWQGTMTHYAIEMDGPYEGVTPEERLYHSVEVDYGDEMYNITVSGKPDWRDDEFKHIIDVKKTSWPPREPYRDHVIQVNLYAWLSEHNGHPIDSATIHYMGPKEERMLPVELWSFEAIEEWVVNRLRQIVAFQVDGILPGPLPKDEQYKAKWCIFKGTGKCCLDGGPDG